MTIKEVAIGRTLSVGPGSYSSIRFDLTASLTEEDDVETAIKELDRQIGQLYLHAENISKATKAEYIMNDPSLFTDKQVAWARTMLGYKDE